MAEVDKKQEIQKLLNALDPDRLAKADFVNAFEKVVKFILANEQRLTDAITRLEETYQNLTERNRNDYVSGLADLKNQTNQLFVRDQLKRIEGETKASFEKRQKEINELVDKRLEEADYRVSLLKPIKGDRGDKGDTGPMPTENLELMRSEEHTSEL